MALHVAATAFGQQRIASRPSGGGSIGGSGASAAASPSDKRIWNEAIAAQHSWTVSPILATRNPVPIDTLMENLAQSVAIPHLQYGYASAITGNLGSEGLCMNYFDRPPVQEFFFNNSLYAYIPRVDATPLYNTRVPMTLVGYNAGGSDQTKQDWLKVRLSGNINARAQVGGYLSYLYSRGMYEHQAGKHFNWGFNGSYLGKRYQMTAIFNNWNPLNKENGGIIDDRYITDPAAVQGGSTQVDTKQIPVNLQDAHSHVIGHEFWMNHAYRMGFHRFNDQDSTSTFVPVSQIFYTFDFRTEEHRFVDKNAADNKFFANTYFNEKETFDKTSQWVMTNAAGIQLLEGFNKYAKAGLSAYARHEVARYKQVAEANRPAVTEHSLFIGGRLAKEQGATLRYAADASIGMAGAKAADLELHGTADLRLRLLGDTVSLRAYADFTNLKSGYFLREFVSNHFMWSNDFGKTRRLRLGGILNVAHTASRIHVGVENAQNVIYFNSEGLPVQHGGSVQIFSASLHQDLHAGILHWDNRLTYQKSSNQAVIPLPDFTAYSNLYILFRVATLHAQLGVDCTYFTRYYAHGYQPAVMAFTNQQDVKLGNYPIMDFYANFQLKKARFYVLYSHFNDGLFGGSGKFSVVHYPLNPGRFLLGISVDFAN